MTHRPGAVLTNVATLGGGLLLFFALPVRGMSAGALVRDILIALAGVAVVAWVTVRQVRGSGRRELTPLELVMLAEVVTCTFSLAYYSLAVHDPAQFVGIHTRLDALYFTLTTMTTVGYGDIHAAAQLARAVVCVHLTFNLVFLAVLASLVRTRLGDRPR
jgi:hypothetical protein